jgi:hypothetical protein
MSGFGYGKKVKVPDNYKTKGECWRCRKVRTTFLTPLGNMMCKNCCEKLKFKIPK